MRATFCGFCLSAFCAVAPTTHADTFIIASQNFNYYPHYNFSSDADKGFIWALLETYAAESGHEFIYTSLPVARLQIELYKGTVDLIYPDNPIFHPDVEEPTSKRYSNTVISTLGGVIVKEQALGRDVSSFKGVSYPLGFTPINWKNETKPVPFELIPTSSCLAALQMVELGKTDAADIDYFVSQYLTISNPSLSRYTLDTSLPHNIVDFKLATVSQIELINDINRFLAANADLVEKLKAQYGLQSPELTFQELAKLQ